MADTFECAWCFEANRVDLEYNQKHGTSIEPTVYVFPVSEIGGYDAETRLPICENCADAANEEEANTAHMEWSTNPAFQI